MLRIKPKASHVLGKCCATEPQPQPFLFFILRQGLAKLLRLALNSLSSCLSLLSHWDYRPVPL